MSQLNIDLSGIDSTKNEDLAIQSMPCKLDYDGEVDLEKYFDPYMAKDNDGKYLPT